MIVIRAIGKVGKVAQILRSLNSFRTVLGYNMHFCINNNKMVQLNIKNNTAKPCQVILNNKLLSEAIPNANPQIAVGNTLINL